MNENGAWINCTSELHFFLLHKREWNPKTSANSYVTDRFVGQMLLVKLLSEGVILPNFHLYARHSENATKSLAMYE